jgi:gentisate 1,2-dioxygenase
MSKKRNAEEVPEWLGNVPFPPDKKVPCELNGKDAKVIFYGSGKEKICVTIYCSTDRILLSQWEVPPGQSFQPADIHSGDETYYILTGELTEVDHTTGQAIRAIQGEVICIPSKTWHNAYNFTDEKLVLLNPAEGGMWIESDLEKVTAFREQTVRYKGHGNESIRDIIGGNWPAGKAPDSYRMVHIPPEMALTVVHGTNNETQFAFFVSNERMHVGKFVICPGKCSDPESHGGDEALKVLKGSLQISVLHDSDEESAVMRDAYRIETGGIFFIPEGRRHQYFNLTSELCEVVFIVAPEL